VTEKSKRVLYVGPMVSWEAQWRHAVNLFLGGNEVTIHDHGADDRCRLDGARCKCGTLTETGEEPTLKLFTLNKIDN
jgi:hypothetical protein